MSNGKLIVFEGIDNSGKDTALVFLKNAFINSGRLVTVIPSVTSTPIGREIRLTSTGKTDRPVNPHQLIVLFIADFYNKLAMIEDALSQGHIVLCSRWYTTTLAYSQADSSITAIERMIVTDIKPDILFYMDISVEESVKRAKRDKHKPKDIYTTLPYLKRAKMLYDIVLEDNKFNTVKVDAVLSRQTVTKFLTNYIIDNYPEYGLKNIKYKHGVTPVIQY